MIIVWPIILTSSNTLLLINVYISGSQERVYGCETHAAGLLPYKIAFDEDRHLYAIHRTAHDVKYYMYIRIYEQLLQLVEYKWRSR